MADVKWIKIVVDIFDDEKIRIIETMPEGDALIVIWFKILCVAGRSNRGGLLMLTDQIPYTDDMLSSVFNRDPRIIKLALTTFQRMGMIEIIDDVLFLPNWEKHQNAERLEKIREQTRLRNVAYRERLRINDANSVTQASRKRHGDGEMTQQNKTKNQEEELEKEPTPPEAAQAIRYCQDAMINLSPKHMDEIYDFINDGIGADMMTYAVDLTIENGSKAWSYTRTILSRWRDAGIRTVEAAKAEQERFKARKQANASEQLPPGMRFAPDPPPGWRRGGISDDLAAE